ncbi:MAG TPA: hypothetical protein V6D09_05810 [Leptolyngbyaceae cyanobacterium]
MKTPTKQLISQSEVNLSQIQLIVRARLNYLWQALTAAIVRKPEVQIWQTGNRAGKTWWNVYNPNTGELAKLGSEQEVRIWLEQSYYKR